MGVSQIRGFARGERAISNLKSGDLSDCFGYLVSGQILLLDSGKRPLSFVLKDEFFLARPFTLQDTLVEEVISADDSTVVLYIPKEVIEQLSEASSAVSKRLASVFEAIMERSELTEHSLKSFPTLLNELRANQVDGNSIHNWIETIEKKRESTAAQIELKKAKRKSAGEKFKSLLTKWLKRKN